MGVLVRSAAGLALLALSAGPLYGQDGTPPQIEFLSPEHPVVVNDARPEVRVRYSDAGSGLALESLRVAVDGRELSGCLAGPDEASCHPAGLRPGSHTITAEIFDLAGNRGTTSFSFQLLLGAGPHEVVFPAAGDTVLSQAQHNTNFGTVPRLQIGPGPTSRVLVRFDEAEIAAAVGAGELSSASLELFLAVNLGSWGPGRPVFAHRVTAEWSEPGATWTCPIDAHPGDLQEDCSSPWEGGTFALDPTASVLHTDNLAGWVGFDVTSDVALSLDGTPDHGWIVQKESQGQGAQNGAALYASREDDQGRGPRLRVVFATPGFADTTAPALAIVAPSEPLVINDATPQILLTFFDSGFGADPESLRITLDGIDLRQACTVGDASAACEPAALANGQHVVSAAVRDLVGNEATASLSFELLLDAEPPVVTITAPADGAVLNTQTLAVEGTVSDGDQVVGATVNGVAAPLSGSSFAATVALGAGTNTVRAVATDRAGNRGFAEIAVIRDTEPPELTVETPLPGQLTNAPIIQVAGRADDELGLAAVAVNGTAATLAGGRFAADVALVEGVNDLLVRATDRAGNVRDLALQVERFTVPTIAITSPTDLSRTTAVAVDVVGTVSDPAAVVVVDEVPAIVSGNTFRASGVPLAVGGNFLSAVATSANGAQAAAKVTVLRDLVPPHVAIYEPRDGDVVFADAVHVSGLVNDVVVGTVNTTEATVTVNGVAAQVANRSFLAEGIPLAPGENQITARAADLIGNIAEVTVRVVRAAVDRPALTLVSGDLQAASAGASLPAPLVVRLSDGQGQPAAGKTVYFRVLEGSGTLGTGRRQLAVATDGAGLAQVSFTLGSRAGIGSHKVEATAAGFAGRAVFTASALPGPAVNLFLDDGDQQEGQVSQELPDPLAVVVTDAGFNRLAGVPVTFRVVQGGGVFSNGEPEITLDSDADGRAVAEWHLGPEPGNAAHVAEAFVASSPDGPFASFTATGVAAGDPSDTSISGVVLDNMNQPVPGVTLRLLDTSFTAQADAHGFFRLTGVPVGTFRLVADGSTAQRPGVWPDLEFVVTTLAGHDNTLGMPIYLLPIDQSRGIYVTETQGGVLTLPEYPGFSLEIAPGSVTFPSGSRSGVISATVVHGDRVPMVPNFGQQPRFIVTIQPPGAAFEPPARLSLPNVDGLAPGEVTELYSFDHDLASFVSIGPGTVAEDGAVLTSNPGVGIIRAGWHCGGNPAASGTTHKCPDCHTCQGRSCVATSGGGCDDKDECTVNDHCENGGCKGDAITIQSVKATANDEERMAVLRNEDVELSVEVTQEHCTTSYEWEFGDGESAEGSAPSHAYQEPGTYTATVTVSCENCAQEQRSASVQVEVVDVLIEDVFSEQFLGRQLPCNKLPPIVDPNNADKNRPMLMGAIAGNVAAISVRARVEPLSDVAQLMVGVRENFTSEILAQALVDPFERSTVVVFTARPGHIRYQVVAGVDGNNDGTLAEKEVSAVFGELVRVFTAQDYKDSIESVRSQLKFTPIALDLAEAFLNPGKVPREAVSAAPEPLVSSNSRLTHPLGAVWSSGCTAMISHYIFPSTSVAAQRVAENEHTEELVKHGANERRGLDSQEQREKILEFFAAPGSPATAVFPQDYEKRFGRSFPLWEWEGRFRSGDDWGRDTDLRLAFGRVSVTGRILEVEVEKASLDVVRITYEGQFTDLYDFDYYTDGIDAAVVQAGFGTLGQAGRVYYDTVQFSRTASSGLLGFNYSFD